MGGAQGPFLGCGTAGDGLGDLGRVDSEGREACPQCPGTATAAKGTNTQHEGQEYGTGGRTFGSPQWLGRER